jgi:hypothetical protein
MDLKYMLVRFLLFSILLITLSFGCNLKDDNNLVCPAVVCTTNEQTFNLKFLNKNSDADLLFGSITSGVKYQVSDVKIYSARFNKNVDFKIDSTNKTNKFLFFSTAVTDEFIITLGNLPTDKLSAETQFIDQPCCDQLKLTKLTLNFTQLTFNPATPTTIILKK